MAHNTSKRNVGFSNLINSVESTDRLAGLMAIPCEMTEQSTPYYKGPESTYLVSTSCGMVPESTYLKHIPISPVHRPLKIPKHCNINSSRQDISINDQRSTSSIVVPTEMWDNNCSIYLPESTHTHFYSDDSSGYLSDDSENHLPIFRNEEVPKNNDSMRKGPKNSLQMDDTSNNSLDKQLTFSNTIYLPIETGKSFYTANIEGISENDQSNNVVSMTYNGLINQSNNQNTFNTNKFQQQSDKQTTTNNTPLNITHNNRSIKQEEIQMTLQSPIPNKPNSTDPTLIQKYRCGIIFKCSDIWRHVDLLAIITTIFALGTILLLFKTLSLRSEYQNIKENEAIDRTINHITLSNENTVTIHSQPLIKNKLEHQFMTEVSTIQSNSGSYEGRIIQSNSGSFESIETEHLRPYVRMTNGDTQKKQNIFRLRIPRKNED